MKAGKTKGGKQMYLCHECGHRFVEDIGKPSYSNGMTFLLGECSKRIHFRGRHWMRVQGSWVYIFHSTAWSWRHKIMEKMKDLQDDIVLS